MIRHTLCSMIVLLSLFSCKSNSARDGENSESKFFNPNTGTFDSQAFNAGMISKTNPIIRETDLSKVLKPAEHSHLLFGKNTFYAAHLPLEDNDDHKYQIIYRVNIDKWIGDNTENKYKNFIANGQLVSIIPTIRLDQIKDGFVFPNPVPIVEGTYKQILAKFIADGKNKQYVRK